ncbi:hypothetical protein acsn021_45050 [Anaerocolumna cellulosilytica]|uniref:Uncharacterized protein n=1 Tax=Anaerocolumna cellulosilytica TaxID=433286 RepID=A0A6S6R476_9FIRM|nr:hypothetical protein [Anaerocolumna cellulosilytica]BCJ96936.1 hypothetical protein acsn021_45050 [Anaerocolumna cellulosilytica]
MKNNIRLVYQKGRDYISRPFLYLAITTYIKLVFTTGLKYNKL